MAQTKPPSSPIIQLLRRLLAYLSQDWTVVLFDLYRFIRPWLMYRQEEGIYEILAYDSTLELVDLKGKVAIFKRHQRVKFLQNNIMVFQDHAWGDGDIFAGYKCSPGVVVDRYQEGDRWNILMV